MRRRILALVIVAAVACSAVVVAIASTTASGLPAYTNGYQSWPKLNKRPIKGGSTAHSGVKNIYASKKRVGKTFPNGTVVVKSILKPGDKPGTPTQVAVMRKLKGKWRYVEYELDGSRYAALDLPQSLCSGCHMQAKASDYVFTK
jgi:hypothetical protein